ncbi:MAG: DapH/DapD/GlmU-related protein [Pedobacter sp.]
MKLFLIYKITKRLLAGLQNSFDRASCKLMFWGNNVHYSTFRSTGVPFISVARGAECIVGSNLSMNNGASGNPVGSFDKCTFFVDTGGSLKVGDNFGISQAAIVCHIKIQIGNNVKLGGGACIYDTDFHSLDPATRANPAADLLSKMKMPVILGNNVFVGARAMILKGVNIGDGSIIGAGSIVTKSIPAGQIWAGNPAKFIRNVS